MKNIRGTILSVLLVAGLLFGCKDETPQIALPDQLPAHQQTAPQAAPLTPQTGMRAGTVKETIDGGGYTYVQVDSDGELFWAAAPAFTVKVGDQVLVPSGMAMPNHHSNTLNRTFDVVYFVSAVQVGVAGSATPAPSQLPQGHPAPQVTSGGEVDFSGLKKVDGGFRVAELFTKRADLVGREVSVRGKVVKFSQAIMGTNWLHLQDGTGEGGANDLTVTTADVRAKVGDTVVITGVLATDKDFGYGYSYSVIIEGAKVTIE